MKRIITLLLLALVGLMANAQTLKTRSDGSFTQLDKRLAANSFIGIDSIRFLRSGYSNSFISPIITGHQGYTWDGNYHYIFDTDRIDKRNNDGTWSIVLSNTSPFAGVSDISHLGDGDYFNGKLYVPAEIYSSCEIFSNQKILVYNSSDLLLVSQFDISAQGHEVSSIAIDGVNNIAYVTSYCDGSKIWKYNATTFEFLGLINLKKPVLNIQGVSYENGSLYLSSDTEGVYLVSLTGEVEFLFYYEGKLLIPEGIHVINGQVRCLVDNIGDGSNSNMFYYDPKSDKSAVLNINKNGESSLSTNILKIDGVASINSTSKVGTLNIGSRSPSVLFIESPKNSSAVIGNDVNNTYLAKNAYFSSSKGWIRPDTTSGSYGVFLAKNVNRIEFRTSSIGSVLSWSTPHYINQKGDFNMVPVLNATGNNQIQQALLISPTYNNGSFTGIINRGLTVSANTNQSIVARNTNSTSYSSILTQDDTQTKYMELIVKNSASTVDNSYGFTGEGGIRSSGGTSGMFLAASNGPLRVLTNNGIERVRVFQTGNVAINTAADDGVNKLQINGTIKATQFKLTSLNTAPTSSTGAGTLGEVRVTSDYIYICIATNTWVRTPLSTW